MSGLVNHHRGTTLLVENVFREQPHAPGDGPTPVGISVLVDYWL
jgi:hypothetical protein